MGLQPHLDIKPCQLMALYLLCREHCPLQGWGHSNPLATADRAPPAQPKADLSGLSAWPACQPAQLAKDPGRQGLVGRGSTAAPAQHKPVQAPACTSWDTQLPPRQPRQQKRPAGAQGQESKPRSHLLQGGVRTLEDPIVCSSAASSRGESGCTTQGQPFGAQERPALLQPLPGAQAGVQQQAWQQLLPQIRTSSRGPGSGSGQPAGKESPLQLPTPCQATEPPAAVLDAALDRAAHPQPLTLGQQPPPAWQSFVPGSPAGRAPAAKVKGRRAGASSSGIGASSSSESDSGTTRARLVNGLVSSTRWPRMVRSVDPMCVPDIADTRLCVKACAWGEGSTVCPAGLAVNPNAVVACVPYSLAAVGWP